MHITLMVLSTFLVSTRVQWHQTIPLGWLDWSLIQVFYIFHLLDSCINFMKLYKLQSSIWKDLFLMFSLSFKLYSVILCLLCILCFLCFHVRSWRTYTLLHFLRNIFASILFHYFHYFWSSSWKIHDGVFKRK